MGIIKHVKYEFEILEKNTPDAIILDFKEEIINLCKKFASSGQSGGSAPYTIYAITKAIENLCNQNPISPITGDEDEWVDMSDYSRDDTVYQNYRCSGIFKDSSGKVKYIDAIVWKGEKQYDTFTGSVYIDDKDFKLIRSSQIVKFPFFPKTFYIDVVRHYISKEEAEYNNLHYIEDGFGDCYFTTLKNPDDLKEVYEYYEKESDN